MRGAGDQLRRLATRAERMEREWPRAAAREVATVLERAAAADTGGDGRLSHGRDLGSSAVNVVGSGRSVRAVVASPRLWGVLQKARPARRTWSRGSAAAVRAAEVSAGQAVREVIGG